MNLSDLFGQVSDPSAALQSERTLIRPVGSNLRDHVSYQQTIPMPQYLHRFLVRCYNVFRMIMEDVRIAMESTKILRKSCSLQFQLH
jgi:hypothetical protein